MTLPAPADAGPAEDRILEVTDLKKHFPIGHTIWGGAKEHVYAVDGISFSIDRGETLALVGESGCGKSTVARSVLRLDDVTGGEIRLENRRIETLNKRAMRPLRKEMQVVFQDPFSSLNPRLRVRDILAEPLRNFGLAQGKAALNDRIEELMDLVRLPRGAMNRWPHEFSGGQRQRIGIARALATNPKLLVCDESVSALDVSVQAQIINLLRQLQQDLGLAMLFISHDLAVVEHMCDRIAVMYLGRIVEIAPRRELFANPKHPYTAALLSAVPVPEPGRTRSRIRLEGDVPSPISPPMGCHFHPRCPFAFDRCRVEPPLLRDRGNGQAAACHLDELPEQPQLSRHEVPA